MTRLQKFLSNIVSFWVGIKTPDGKFVGTAIRDWVADAFGRMVAGVLRSIEMDYTPLLKKVIDQAEKTGEVPEEIKPILQEMKQPSKQIAAMLGNTAASGLTGGIISSTIGPFLKVFEYRRNREAKQARFDFMSAIAVMYRKPEEREAARSDLLDQGWDKHRMTVMEDVAKTRLKEELLVTLRLRGIITKEQYATRMFALGYDATEAEDEYKALLAYPGISDIVRMAVREAYTPEIAERFGQYQDIPPAFITEAAKVGLLEENARQYWAAHWDLPSTMQGFDMLHRGIITQDELKLLLRALDVMPFWRDKLIQLSFVPFTRVDVRRMHKLGILTEAQVKQAYMDIGYSPEKAAALTKFTLALNAGTATQTERDLTKAEMVSAFKKRIISEGELQTWLKEFGYSDAEIRVIIDSSRTVADVATRDLTLSQVKDLYQKGLRTKVECNAFLMAFGFGAAALEALYSLWDWEKPAADRIPSRTDFDAFIAAGIIDINQWSDGYTLLGYDMKYQELYFALLVEKGKIEG